MHADGSDPEKAPARRGATRERILDAANQLFYSQGIRATSADRIIEMVGITKVTFYRHFRTKGDLVVAYLEQQAAAERAWMESVIEKGDPIGSLRAFATSIGEASCQPGFRGCAFINAAAEFADAEDPVRMTVDAHRAWMLHKFEGVAREAAVRDVAATARQLMLLRDGAMVNGYLGAPEEVAASLGAAFTSIVEPARS
ncbi:AcrR family transcriptional regulator [Microbacterium sp. W4I4]|uniref:TetR/AcrR family transcriptional regulator n=1 Tax=Microbacterium sp. W4I4 TaxID=3042295 RepID=UPI00278A3ACA|nr:TetR/AcrR family transcriptional regulator [Microbacterium sp. W4I4]MDQ0615375.1 AcrR family transcriptional regulator [Microbacterium sp. W4I4]